MHGPLARSLLLSLLLYDDDGDDEIEGKAKRLIKPSCAVSNNGIASKQ